MSLSVLNNRKGAGEMAKQNENPIQIAAKKALDYVREKMPGSEVGSEREVLETFIEEFEAEVGGWEMRLSELKSEED